MQRFANPGRFMRFSGQVLPWCAAGAAVSLALGLYIALVNGFDDATRGARAGAVLALVGVVNLPIIKFSVDWWNTLHQPASVLRVGGPTIDNSMLVPLLVMAVAFMLYFAALLMLRM